MSREVDIKDFQIEEYCISFLRKRGYVVRKVKEITVERTEASVIQHFYQKAIEFFGNSLGSEFKSYEKDAAVLRKLIKRFEELGMSQQTIYEYIVELIDFSFNYPHLCGGPFKSFRIFSSETFLDSLVYYYEINEEERNEEEWRIQSKIDFANKVIDISQVKSELLKMKEAISNGKKSSG